MKNCVFGFWNTEPTVSAILYMGGVAISRSATLTEPLTSASFTKWGNKPVYELCHCGFSATAFAAEQYKFSLANRQVYIRKNIFAFNIYAYVFEFDHNRNPISVIAVIHTVAEIMIMRSEQVI